jgi:hypothetical protein
MEFQKSSELLDQNEEYELPHNFRRRAAFAHLYEQIERLTTSEPRRTACDQESANKSLVGFPRNLVQEVFSKHCRASVSFIKIGPGTVVLFSG